MGSGQARDTREGEDNKNVTCAIKKVGEECEEEGSRVAPL